MVPTLAFWQCPETVLELHGSDVGLLQSPGNNPGVAWFPRESVPAA